MDMDYKDIIKTVESTKRLIDDEYYYKYIFKKTERVVSVVFYVLHYVQEDKKTEAHVEDIRHAAQAVHNAILHSLETRQQSAEAAVDACVVALVSLQSQLYVASVTGLITKDVYTTFTTEIDTIFRGLSRYTNKELLVSEPEPIERLERHRSAPASSLRSAPRSKDTTHERASTASSGGLNRRERIRTVLEARGEASIKDISDIITDCSEKTIQRDLNAMIEDNVVQRQGERRWARYLLIS